MHSSIVSQPAIVYCAGKMVSIVNKCRSEYKLASDERVEKGTGNLKNVMGIVWQVGEDGIKIYTI